MVPLAQKPGLLERITAPPASRDDPRWMLLVGLAVFSAGYALVRYRDAIGNATGYFARGMYVSARTPGWLLLPFGVLMMLGGATVVVGSLYMILFG